MKQKIQHLLHYLLIALFVSYYLQSALFVHTHQVSWGLVTHSHPYIPSSGHSHSSVECVTIAQLSHLLFTLVQVFFLAAILSVVSLLFVSIPRHLVARYTEHCSLRAPPAISL